MKLSSIMRCAQKGWPRICLDYRLQQRCNGLHSLKACARRGGYEGGRAIYYGLPAFWGPRVEEIIVGAVHEEQVRKVEEK